MVAPALESRLNPIVVTQVERHMLPQIVVPRLTVHPTVDARGDEVVECLLRRVRGRHDAASSGPVHEPGIDHPGHFRSAVTIPMSAGLRQFPPRRCRSNPPALVNVWWQAAQCAAASPDHCMSQHPVVIGGFSRFGVSAVI